MAAGVPIVHSDAPALVEVAGKTGLQAARGDPVSLLRALRKVINDPVATKARVEAARARAARFTWERAARAVWQVHLGLYQANRIG